MTKFYLAGAYSRRQELAGYAYKMRFAGYEISSGWLSRQESDRALTAEGREEIALEDLHDLDRADAIVRFTDPIFVSKRKFVPRHLLSAARQVEMGVPKGVVSPVYPASIDEESQYTRYNVSPKVGPKAAPRLQKSQKIGPVRWAKYGTRPISLANKGLPRFQKIYKNHRFLKFPRP